MSSIIVGVNSYISLATADSIVQATYLSIDKERAIWNALSDDDKETLIITYTAKLNDEENIWWKGTRVNSDVTVQPLAFPRVVNGIQRTFSYWMQEGLIRCILTDLKNKQSQTYQLQEQGVKSYSDGGGMSVSFDTSGSGLSSQTVVSNALGLNAAVFDQYFKPYTEFVRV